MSKPPTITFAEAREKLQEITGDLARIRSRLLEVGAGLPESAESWRPLDVQETLDAAVELRAIIQCVVDDSVSPAIADLWGAAEWAGNYPAQADEKVGTS